MRQLYTHFEPAPFGGVHAHMLELRGDEWLALCAAMDDRAAMTRRQNAEREEAKDLISLSAKLAIWARHKAELREINDRIDSIKAMGA